MTTDQMYEVPGSRLRELKDARDALEGLMDALDGLDVSGAKDQMTIYTKAWVRAHEALRNG